MDYIKICNWKKHQHYKDRNPPWIKLHNDLLTKYKYRCLQDASKLLLISLWLLRCKQNGDIPKDLAYIREITAIKGKINLQPLIKAGFIECYSPASKPLAPKTETETETEQSRGREETETEQRETKFGIVDDGNGDGLDSGRLEFRSEMDRQFPDNKAVSNFVAWLSNQVVVGKYSEEIKDRVGDYVRESFKGGAKNPPAVFMSRVKKELGYQPCQRTNY